MRAHIGRRVSTWVTGCLLVVALGAAGCKSEGKLAMDGDMSGGLWGVKIISPAFNNGDAIPAKYTADGDNISPPLKWSAGPRTVKQWALIMQDKDAPGKDGYAATHWAVFMIPPNVTELPEGAASTMRYRQGQNYKGEAGYAGPAPEPGKPHRYHFQIFALGTEQNIP